MPSKLALKHKKKSTAEDKRNIMKMIFEQHFGINVFAGSRLENFIFSQFRPGQRNNPFTQIIEDFTTDTEPLSLARHIAQEMENACEQDHANDSELLRVADFMQSKLIPIITILNSDNSIAKRAITLTDFIVNTIAALTNKGVPENTPEIKRLRTIQSNVANIVEMDAFGEITEASGSLLKMHDLMRFGTTIRKIAPHATLLVADNSSKEEAIQAAFASLYHIGTGLQQTKLQNLASVLKNGHWLLMLDLHEATCPQTLDQVLQSLQLHLGQNTIYNLKMNFAKQGISEAQAIEIFELVKKPPYNHDLIQDTRQTQKFAAASALIADIAKQINCRELEKIAQSALCIAGVRQFYTEISLINTSPAKLTSLTQTTGIILSACGAVTDNRTISMIGNSIICGVSSYQLALASIPGGALIALPMAALSVLGNIINNGKSRRQQKQENLQIRQQHEILAYVKQTHTHIIALHNHMQASFAQLYTGIMQSHSIIIEEINRLSRQIDFQYTSLSLQLTQTKSELDYLQYVFSEHLKDIYLQEILRPIAKYDLMRRINAHKITNIEKILIKMLQWVLSMSKETRVNGYDLLSENHTQKKYLLLGSIIRRAQDDFAVLGAVEAYLRAEGFGVDFGLSEMVNLPIWISSVEAINDLLEKFNEQLSTDLDKDEIYRNLLERTQEIRASLISFAQRNDLIEFLANQIRNQYDLLMNSLADKQPQIPKAPDILLDFASVKNRMLSSMHIKDLLSNSNAIIQHPYGRGSGQVVLDTSDIFFRLVYPKIEGDLGINAYLSTLECVLTTDNQPFDEFARYLNEEVGTFPEYLNLTHLLPIRVCYKFTITINDQKINFANVRATANSGGLQMRHKIYAAMHLNVPPILTYNAINVFDDIISRKNDERVATPIPVSSLNYGQRNLPILQELLQNMHQELNNQPNEHFSVTITPSEILPDNNSLLERDQSIKVTLYQQRSKILANLSQELINNEALTKASMHSYILNIILAIRGSDMRVPDLLSEFTKIVGTLSSDHESNVNVRTVLNEMQPHSAADIFTEGTHFRELEIIRHLDFYIEHYQNLLDPNTLSARLVFS